VAVLTSSQRKLLEEACLRGRKASEQSVRAVLGPLAVLADRPPAHLTDDDRALRRGLRAKARQLGDEGERTNLLVAECSYEQWHRLLFARFLAENRLLIHPDFRVAVTVDDCEELAESLGEPDGWSVAGRFAAEILPGIFRVDDPCVQLRLAPEGRVQLEGVVANLPSEIFTADDALGWVYQFWQKDKKDEINASERKIGGTDLGPVTQLFTENYMVRFLLENSLGAWWARRHPESPLANDFDYLRIDENGKAAAGGFDGWPTRVADVTVVDPCCGSGHFLVEAFGMLWRMRAEEEGLGVVDAQDAVLRDNLFGLELDSRCVQIAMFALALQAWKTGGGWRQLPVPQIACSGIPTNAPADEWKSLAHGDVRLEDALERLHVLFRDAGTLGSLIDPRRTIEMGDSAGLFPSLFDAGWEQVAPLLANAAESERHDPAAAVLGADAAGLARAADYLSRRYTLVATNVPYLGQSKQSDVLKTFARSIYPEGKADLSTIFLLRARHLVSSGGSYALVTPQNWRFLTTYRRLRVTLLSQQVWALLANLGPRAFSTSMWDFNVGLGIFTQAAPGPDQAIAGFDASTGPNPDAKAALLRHGEFTQLSQIRQLHNKDAAIVWVEPDTGDMLSKFVDVHYGSKPGQTARVTRKFWELALIDGVTWWRMESTPGHGGAFTGKSEIALTPEAMAAAGIVEFGIRGREAWGQAGVILSQMNQLPCCLYLGSFFDNNTSVIVPRRSADLMPIFRFMQSSEFRASVRARNQKLDVDTGAMVEVPIDIDRWRNEFGGEVRPDPTSDDPTQWLFEGRPAGSTAPLQVAVGRLLGYRWPAQAETDDVAMYADNDGIVCLPSVRGERTAGERLQELLAKAFGGTWSPARARELIARTGSSKEDLASWLREDFFKAHCQLFKNRPFVWHIWDGRKDGFAALVNYHRLDRPTLQTLAYTYLGDWIERQAAGVRDDVAGAEDRLVAARDLRRRLELILEGVPPHDIYIRWKPLALQPIGWDPDINDGVRLNLRPFVEAEVLRGRFNVKWEKDRGKNPDGTERLNHLHFTHAEKLAAREGARP
jgi:hypothetical protein